MATPYGFQRGQSCCVDSESLLHESIYFGTKREKLRADREIKLVSLYRLAVFQRELVFVYVTSKSTVLLTN